MLKNPVSINLQRESAPPAGITHAVYPVSQALKAALLLELLRRNVVRDVLVFTRTKHRADRLAAHLVRAGIKAERIHGNRSQSQRTLALSGFKAGRYRVLVATDLAARGIDVTALGHVVNFDVPPVPEDYIHRVGRTGRAEATGDAITFSSPEEREDLQAIERAIRQALPRVTLADFDYHQGGEAALEVPREERIKAIRAQRAQARANAERKRSRTPGAPASHHAPARPFAGHTEWRARSRFQSGGAHTQHRSDARREARGR
jgi:ATP-dependent RNA helicase RhlE